MKENLELKSCFDFNLKQLEFLEFLADEDDDLRVGWYAKRNNFLAFIMKNEAYWILWDTENIHIEYEQSFKNEIDLILDSFKELNFIKTEEENELHE